MKFVVPLTIPSTRWTFETTSDSRSTLITGIAAHTDASKRSCTPASEAAEKSSAPRRATSCLFAVTTGLPARRSSSTRVPVGSRPPVTSATSAIAGSSRIASKSVVRTPCAGWKSRSRSGSRTRAAPRAADGRSCARSRPRLRSGGDRPPSRRCRNRAARRGRPRKPSAYSRDRSGRVASAGAGSIVCLQRHATIRRPLSFRVGGFRPDRRGESSSAGAGCPISRRRRSISSDASARVSGNRSSARAQSAPASA